jgi:hypothetical protein
VDYPDTSNTNTSEATDKANENNTDIEQAVQDKCDNAVLSKSED